MFLSLSMHGHLPQYASGILDCLYRNASLGWILLANAMQCLLLMMKVFWGAFQAKLSASVMLHPCKSMPYVYKMSEFVHKR